MCDTFGLCIRGVAVTPAPRRPSPPPEERGVAAVAAAAPAMKARYSKFLGILLGIRHI
jgi:hypothetical protein